MSMWAPQGLGFNLRQNPRYYSNPQGGTVPFSLASGTGYKPAFQQIQTALRAGNGSALDSYFGAWKPQGTVDPQWLQKNWLQAYLAFPGNGGGAGPAPGTTGPDGTLSGVPWRAPSGWGGNGVGPLLPSTGQPMY